MPITTKRYARQDIIDAALFNIGYGVINIELQTYAPQAIEALLDKSLNDINNYVPEPREQTVGVTFSQGGRNGYADIPDTYRDGRLNDPLVVVGIEPNGMSWYERQQDFGVLTFNRFLYTYSPETDYNLLDNFKTRKRIYGIDFKWKQDPSRPKRVYFDDLPYSGNTITVAFLNYWSLDAGYYNGTTNATNYIYGEAASRLIDLLTARVKKPTGAIRAKLAGGNRAAVLDGERIASEGAAEEEKVMEALQTAALVYGHRQE